MSIEQDFTVFSGNDIVLKFTVLDNATGEALDLTGATELIWELAKSAKATAIITKTLLDGVVVTSAAEGLIEVTLTDEELEPLKGFYYHELRLTNADDKKSTLCYGSVEILVNLIRD